MIILERDLNPIRTRVIKDGETVTRDQLHSEGWELLPVGFKRVTCVGVSDIEEGRVPLGIVSLSRGAKFQVSAREPNSPIEISGQAASETINVTLFPGQRLGIVNERLLRQDIEIRSV